MRPPIPSITLSRRAKIALWTAVILIALIIALVQLTGVYINFLWFDSVGFRGVYTTIFWTRVTLFFLFGVVMALVIGGNMVIAYLLAPPFRPMSPEQQNIERYRAVLEPRRILVLSAVSLIALFSAGLSAQDKWSTWQLWLHGQSFGTKDPLFHLDVSFFAFDYPAYRLLLGFGFSAIIFSIILSVLVHYLSGAIRLQTPGPKVTIAARRHLTILAFVFVVLKAIAYWLDRYGLVFSDRSSKFTGASYTDYHAVLPSRTILFWIALVIAAGLIASLWLRSSVLPGIAFVSMLVLSILISGIYPAILQSVSVRPNASSKEAPYIRRNLDATREAYNLVAGKNVKYKDFVASKSPDVTAPTQQNNPTLDNIRILDPNVVSPTFQRFQQGGTNVFGFNDKLDVDRYTINGVERDYMVGVREMDTSKLNPDQANWINQHTVYTHGIGLVAAAANKDITADGTASQSFAAGNIPPSGELKPTQGDVYYGELMPDYAIVGANGAPQEFNGDNQPKVRYAGGGGVSLGNLFTRLAFAVNYQQSNFVLNDAASATGAKIIFNRDPRAMVQKVAPFLKLDGDPYAVIDQSRANSGDPSAGHIVWMVDGFTTMDNFPYSARNSLSTLTSDSLAVSNRTAQQPNDQINYIRNSVKATVDAYTGKVTLYQWDPNDALLNSWKAVFPGIVHPKSDMPTALQAHVRYPQDLFKVQRTILGTYHVNDPGAFYNVTQKWTVPTDPTDSSGVATGANQPAYYVLAAPPLSGSSKPEFQLTSPMNVNSASYVAAYLSVDSDPQNYGQISVLQVSGGNQSKIVQGPEQIYTQITQNGTIRKDSLQQTGSGGSTALHGNLLTLPLGDSFLYVEPLYTVSSNTTSGSYPTLLRVIVFYGGKIGYGGTLADALSDFEPGHCTGETIQGFTCGTGSGGTPTPGPAPPTPAPASGSTSPPVGGSVTIGQVDAAIVDLQNAYKTGNSETIGKALQRVRDLVEAYQAKTAPSGATSSSGAPKTSGSPPSSGASTAAPSSSSSSP